MRMSTRNRSIVAVIILASVASGGIYYAHMKTPPKGQIGHGDGAKPSIVSSNSDDDSNKLNDWIRDTCNPDAEVRHNAMYNISSLGSKAVPAIPALIAALSGDDWDRGFASSALESIGEIAVPALIDALSSKSVNTREGAVLTLKKLGPVAANAAPRLVALLDDPVTQVRVQSCYALHEIHNLSTINDLLRAMENDKEFAVRCAAARAVAFGPEASAVVPRIVANMCLNRISSGDAMIALIEIGKPAILEILAVAESMRQNKEYRIRMIWALEQIGILDEIELNRAIDLLNDPDESIRMEVLAMLMTTGKGNDKVLQRIERALEDQAPLVRISAAEAVFSLSGKIHPAIDVIVREMGNKDKDIRVFACGSLVEFASNAREVLPEIRGRLYDTEPQVRRKAVRVLRELGSAATIAIPEIESMAANDADADVRKEASKAITEIKRTAP